MRGIAAVLPFAITTARRAVSGSPPTSTVRRSLSFPSPRKSRAPVASIAAAGWLSSRLRAIHSTRVEILGKSTVHSTHEAARTRARSASVSVSPERSSVFDGTHPQYGHSPPTSSRSTTANVRPLSRSPPRWLLQPPHRPDRRHRIPVASSSPVTAGPTLLKNARASRRRHQTLVLVPSDVRRVIASRSISQRRCRRSGIVAPRRAAENRRMSDIVIRAAVATERSSLEALHWRASHEWPM